MAGRAGDPVGDRAALAVCWRDAQRQRLQALQQHPGVEGRHGRPGLAQEGLDVPVDELLRAQDHAAEAAPLPVDVLGRRIDDAIGAELPAGAGRAASRRRCRRRASRRPPARSRRRPAMSTSSSVGLAGVSRKNVFVFGPDRGAPALRGRGRRPASIRRRSAAGTPRSRSGRSRTAPARRRRGRRPRAGRPATPSPPPCRSPSRAPSSAPSSSAMRLSNIATVGLEKRA